MYFDHIPVAFSCSSFFPSVLSPSPQIVFLLFSLKRKMHILEKHTGLANFA